MYIFKRSKIKSKSSTKKSVKSSDISVSPSNKHVLPAILSFFIHALGQFVKGQVRWGLIIWLWFILGNLLLFVLSGIFGLFMIIWLVFFAAIIGSIVFWILMTVDVVKMKFPKEDDKTPWVLVVVLTGIIGAIIY